MSETLAHFNSLPRNEAEKLLRECCGSRAWTSTMAARRPFADLPELMNTAGEVWDQLAAPDRLEAFAAHPRLGESGGHAPDSSKREQSRIMSAEEETLKRLAEENRNYETRFGRVFLFAAAGRTAPEVLAALRQRMTNDAATELTVAAAEQRKITRLRLESMLQG